ncbi:hypothetical protein K7432_013835 [Basidiobolus ranarum]|uniref:Uncharacterized protein n=1 Tax=Basidiobolus ranarum TaxID=34480 RepID=A0ABR2VQB1_9FUNG
MSNIFRTKLLLARLCLGLLVLWVCVETKSMGEQKRSTPDTPSNNPLGLKANYQVAWLNTSTGQFGGNLTLFLPVTTSPTTHWSLKFLFADQYTKINEYWGDWTMERYKSGSYVILPVSGKEHIVESYCFNGQFIFNDTLDKVMLASLISPSSYILLLNPASTDEQEITLSTNDYTNTPLDTNTPSNSFGPYFRALRPLSKPNSSAIDANEFGDGTTIQTTPVGLYIYGIVFLIGAGVAGAGTYRRLRYRTEFRGLVETQKQQTNPFHRSILKN